MLEKNKKQMYYAAFKSKDTRFDGRFFVGVLSTGIYCRPVCRAKLPKIENCNFYSTAAEAEKSGFRPCLLCRPELAPGTSITDATSSLAQHAAKILEENCGTGESISDFAQKLACSDRHLRRVFMAEYNVSPVQYLQTCRLLLAKNLLTDTNLSVLEVAMASGFGSLRRFNDLFKKQYKLVPTALRHQNKSEQKNDNSITVALAYRPPYQWEKILSFLEARAISGIEIIKNNEYYRTVHLVDRNQQNIYGYLKVSHNMKKKSLEVTLSSTLLPVLTQVIARVKNLFDLYCDPSAIYEELKSMNEINPGFCILGARLPGCFDPFEMTVRAILGQQITVKAANTLAARLVKKYGTPVESVVEGLTHTFPTQKTFLNLEKPIENYLGPLGIIATRAKAILELANLLDNGEINFDFSFNPEIDLKKLLSIKGIGPWTAQYIVMRTMKWTDAFLETDYGVKKALAPYSSKEILNLAEKWRPWRSYATINLWNSL